MTDYKKQPEVGTIWSGQGFKIKVIHKDDPCNIDENGNYKRTGQVIYQYLSNPNGKIGHCKKIEGFYACWG